MKRLLLDHLRRKVWFLVAAALFTALLGWGTGAAPEAARRQLYGLVAQAGVIVGSAMLFWDLQRGAGRSVALLPLSRAQVGRAWWLASVAAPSGVLSFSFAVGALAHALFSTKGGLHLEPLLATILSLWLFTGTAFWLLLGMPLGPAQGWKQRSATAGWIFVLSSGALMSRLPLGPGLLVVLLTLGVGATVLGWFLAPHLVGRGPRTDGSVVAKNTQAATTNPGPPLWGGVPFLVAETARRALYLTALFLGGLVLFHFVVNAGQSSSPKLLRLLPIMAASAFPFTLFFSILFLCPQLRSLRSLPLSSRGLATLLLGLTLLPAMIFSALVFAVLACFGDSPFKQTFALTTLLYLSVGALTLLGLVLLGGGKRSMAFIIALFFGGQFAIIPLSINMHEAQSPVPLGLAAAATALVIMLVLFALTAALARCGRVYRPKAFGDIRPAWERP